RSAEASRRWRYVVHGGGAMMAPLRWILTTSLFGGGGVRRAALWGAAHPALAPGGPALPDAQLTLPASHLQSTFTLIYGLCRPLTGVLAPAAPPVAVVASAAAPLRPLRHFVGGEYVGSAFYFRHIDMALLLGLSVIVAVWDSPSTLAAAEAKFGLSAALLLL